MAQAKSTFCRICEPACRLKVHFGNAGDIVSLSPERRSDWGGEACHKGLSFLDVHNDPDRANWPHRRHGLRGDDEAFFEAVTWEQALGDIGKRLKKIRQRFGNNAVATYNGNPFGFSTAGLIFSGIFQDTMETASRFSANTQDTSNKMTAAGYVYGSEEAFMVPDIYNTEYLLCLGSNPKVSRWTAMSAPKDWDVVKRIQARGGKVRFVNPRRTESSSSDTGETVLIRPGADVYFLAGLLHQIEKHVSFGSELMGRFGKNVRGLQDFISKFPPEKVAAVTGISPEDTEKIAAEILAAKSAAVYMATGVNQSRQGVLCSWLVEMIQLATGNLGRLGGTFKPNGLTVECAPKQGTQLVSTSMGQFELPNPIGFGMLPGTLLPDLIEGGDIKALIVLGGNPALSMAGGERARRAYEKLDLLVCLDIYRNATGELADYVLPTTDWLERLDIDHLSSGMQMYPSVQLGERMVSPAFGRRDDWWILARILQEVGLPNPLDANPDCDWTAGLIEQLLSGKKLSIEQLKVLPHQTAMLETTRPDSLFERCLVHDDRLIDCCPAAFVESGLFARCDRIFEELSSEPIDCLKIISLRTPYMHNSWFTNVTEMRRGINSENTLHICEEDAYRLGMIAGDEVHVVSAYGQIKSRLFIDNNLGRGTVAMSHGYGHQRASGLKVAQAHPGSNLNELMPTGVEAVEPLSYMAWLTGVPVNIERVTVG